MKKLIGIAALGFLLTFKLPLNLSDEVTVYLSLYLLVAVASLLGIIVEIMEGKVSPKKWAGEITSNLLLSTFLTFVSLGQKIPLHYAVIIYFGMKIFENSEKIRYFLLKE